MGGWAHSVGYKWAYYMGRCLGANASRVKWWAYYMGRCLGANACRVKVVPGSKHNNWENNITTITPGAKLVLIDRTLHYH